MLGSRLITRSNFKLGYCALFASSSCHFQTKFYPRFANEKIYLKNVSKPLSFNATCFHTQNSINKTVKKLRNPYTEMHKRAK